MGFPVISKLNIESLDEWQLGLGDFVGDGGLWEHAHHPELRNNMPLTNYHSMSRVVIAGATVPRRRWRFNLVNGMWQAPWVFV